MSIYCFFFKLSTSRSSLGKDIRRVPGQIGRLRNARVHTIYLLGVWTDQQTFRVS
jgi:hypothetical protein